LVVNNFLFPKGLESSKAPPLAGLLFFYLTPFVPSPFHGEEVRFSRYQLYYFFKTLFIIKNSNY